MEGVPPILQPPIENFGYHCECFVLDHLLPHLGTVSTPWFMSLPCTLLACLGAVMYHPEPK